MGNKATQKTSFNIIDISELKEFLSRINVLDGFYMDTNLSISSKCLAIINNLINHLSVSNNVGDDLYNYQHCEIFTGVSIPFDKESFDKIEKLKSNCQLMRHLSIFNSNFNVVEEYIELNNFTHLVSLHLENLPIKFVTHLKSHRSTLLKLCVHKCISDLESLIELCGGDQSFSGNWSNLLHLDIRYNTLKTIDNSVILLTGLTVLDISRNDVQCIAFVEQIPTLLCLNASYNCIKYLPKIGNHCLRVLIIGYNYLESLEDIRNFKLLSTFNASYNMIDSEIYLRQLSELDYLKDLILSGNPICTSNYYRLAVLNLVSSRVMINFALDGKIFTKRERNSLNKVSMIVIAPPTNSNSNLNKSVLVIKPKPNLSKPKSNQDANYDSYTRKSKNCAKISDQENDINYDGVVCQPELQLLKSDSPKMTRKEKKIESMDTLNDLTINQTIDELTSDVMVSTVFKPYYIGEKTSNLLTASSKGRSSFMKVSFQIIEHKFMAVDEYNKTVENIDLWTLLVACLEKETVVLKLVFCDLYTDKQLNLSHRILEFATVDELKNFYGLLDVYLQGFTIKFDNFSWNSVVMLCTHCQSNYQFNGSNYRPILCPQCLSVDFVLEPVKNTEVKKNILSPPTGLSPAKSSKYIKSGTSALLLKAFSSENINISDKNEYGVSNSTSYRSTLDEQNELENISNVDSLNGSQELPFLEDERFNISVLDTLNLDIPIICLNDEQLLDNPKNVIPKIPIENVNLDYINKLQKANWIIHQPLSNINIYMDNINKIDDRVKLYFLSKIMNEKEDVKAVFKTYLLFKSTSSVTIEVLAVLSTFRLLLYSWIDKDSASFEDCLKLIVEYKLVNLDQVYDYLNHQWIYIKGKHKTSFLLFIGDHEAARNIMLTITQIVSDNATKLSIRAIKNIDDMKTNNIKSVMAKAMHDESNIQALDNCEYFLIRSCSCMPADKSLSEYAPKMICIQSEHLFLLNLKFQNKLQQTNFELWSTLSFYDLVDSIIVDSRNDYRCKLSIRENNIINTIIITFMSPATRSQALTSIAKLWKKLWETTLNFDIKPIDDVEES